MSDAYLLRLYLWPHRVLYLGLSPDNELHRHHAAQICVSLDGTLHVEDDTGSVESSGVVVAPDHGHRINAGVARILALYLEPESDEYVSLMGPLFSDGGSNRVASLEMQPRGLASLQALYETGGEADHAWSICVAALGLGASTGRLKERDHRIEHVIDIIRREPSASHSLDRLAGAVHLSPSRLAHLFRAEVGVPIRRFTVWSRIRRVVQLAVEGSSLTDAAHAAGFSDAAHMSNTFRQMFGFAPSALFARQIARDIQLID